MFKEDESCFVILFSTVGGNFLMTRGGILLTGGRSLLPLLSGINPSDDILSTYTNGTLTIWFPTVHAVYPYLSMP